MIGVVQAACQRNVTFTGLLMRDAADLADALSWISTFKHRRSRKLWQGRTAPVLQPDLIPPTSSGTI